jgi:Zn-dependent protease with chaperone function
MTRTQFEALVQKIEPYAAANPAAYAARVRLLALGGFAYIFAVLAVCVGLMLLMVWGFVSGAIRPGAGTIKVMLVLLVLAYYILASLWVRIPPVEGRRLSCEEAPELFRAVDETAHALQVRPPHNIYIISDFNAMANQRNRFGILGGTENNLLLGLPFLMAMSPEQVRGTIAHELGHLAGGHGKFGGWIYRLNQTWENLLTSLGAGSRGFHIVGSFIKWYAPYFNAYTFPLRRQNEYEADQAEVRLTGAKAAGESLILMELVGRNLNERFWKPMTDLKAAEKDPPHDAFTRMREFLREPLPPQAAAWLQKSMRTPPSIADTHPPLSMRLAAMGYPETGAGTHPSLAQRLQAIDTQAAVEVPSMPSVRASDALLGKPLTDALLQHYDAEWAEGVGPLWEARREQIAAKRQRIAELQAAATLTEDEEVELAVAIGALEGEEAALPLFRSLCEKYPDNDAAAYHYGTALLTLGDEGGIEVLEGLRRRNPFLGTECLEAVLDFLAENARFEDAERYRTALLHHMDLMDAAAEERSVTKGEKWEPHDLPDSALQPVRNLLAQYPEVKAAWMAKLVVKHFPEHPLLGMVVEPDRRKVKSAEEHQALAQSVVDGLPLKEQVVLLTVRRENPNPNAARIRKVKGSEIYKRT